MSETTAQPVLLADIVRRLTPRFSDLVPFAFDLTREGQEKARHGPAGNVRIIATYARRPKVTHVGASEIIITASGAVLHHAQLLQMVGIPTLLAVPLVSRLSDLRHTTSCAWFEVRQPESADVCARMTLEGIRIDAVGREEVRGPLSDGELAECLSSSRPVTWLDALGSVRAATLQLKQSELIPRTPYGRHPRYKPFYLVALDQ